MLVKHLTYLTALARERHFGRAAESCGISQPALSAAIRQIEGELGVRVVERSRRFIGFTPEGQLVLDRAQRLVHDFESLRQDISVLKRALAGRLRIGAIPAALPVIALLTTPFCAQHAWYGCTWLTHLPVGELRRRNEAALEHQLDEPLQPDLIIAAGEIPRRRQAFAGSTRLVQVPLASGTHRQGQAKDAPLPIVVKPWLVRFGQNRAEVLHATHVVHAVHQRSEGSCAGCFGMPVPIMESRVTSVASCSSLQPSVPSGLIGSTR